MSLPEQLSLDKLKQYQRTSFVERLEKSKFSREGVARVIHAYDFAEEAHIGQNRETGERFFEHALGTASILLDLGIDDENTIMTAFLHDVFEDTNAFGELEEGVEYRTLVEQAYGNIKKTHRFGREVALMTLTVSRPKIDNIEIMDKEQAEELFDEQFKRGIPYGLQLPILSRLTWVRRLRSRILLIKLADRVHNFRTLYTQDPERIKRKIEETEQRLIPICHHAESDYPKETEYLIGKLHETIKVVSERFNLTDNN